VLTRLGFLLLVACATRTVVQNVKAPEAGISIALYARGDTTYGVVDDRRWLTVDGNTILLANIDPGAALASLVIESVVPALHIGQCVRERLPDPVRRDPADAQDARSVFVIRRFGMPVAPPPVPPRPAVEEARFAPLVRCAATAPHGRYLVRILYVTTRLGYRAQHELELAGDRAQLTSRYAIATPPWGERASLALYEGAPGGERAPVEIARGAVTLDGSTAVLATPTRDVRAALRRIYDGAVISGDDTTDITWGHDSVSAVWVWLELAALRLAPGPVHVHLEIAGEGLRDLDIPMAQREQDDAVLRLPLWVDPQLRGTRQRLVDYNDGVMLTERLVLGVANLGDTPREVWIEEHVRRANKRRLDHPWPKKPTLLGDVVRSKVDARPGRIERTGYTLHYSF